MIPLTEQEDLPPFGNNATSAYKIARTEWAVCVEIMDDRKSMSVSLRDKQLFYREQYLHVPGCECAIGILVIR